jgi:UDP-N-acetylglucosamine 1-carboxyvinyltransferase
MSDSFVVRACGPLHGTVRVSGATKNAGTKQMAAALLAPGVTTLRNVDPVADLDVMIDVLRAIGARVEWAGTTELQIDASAPLHAEAPYELVTRMRASINVLGPLLARCGEARVAMPGGDNIGSRKLDMHFRGLAAMGVELEVVHGFIEARTNRLSGARVMLEFPSVGATENLLTAAVLAKGETVIENAAREPELTDLADMLNRMGAEIHGAGTSTLVIEGVDELAPVESEIMADRIETGTLLMAVGITGGDAMLLGGRIDHVETVVMKLGEMGLQVTPTPDGLEARADDPGHGRRLRPSPRVRVVTGRFRTLPFQFAQLWREGRPPSRSVSASRGRARRRRRGCAATTRGRSSRGRCGTGPARRSRRRRPSPRARARHRRGRRARARARPTGAARRARPRASLRDGRRRPCG